MLGWWSKRRKTPDNLKQNWIIEGFKECLDGFFVIQNNDFFISNRLISMLGYEAESDFLTSEEGWREIIYPEDRARVIQYIDMRRKSTNNLKNQIECRLKHRAGHFISVLITSYISPTPKSPYPLMGTVVNINSYRVLQDQLERTIQDAEKASQTKTKFIASLNHELRTPLSGIMGVATLLRETPLDETQQKYINTILSSTQMLLTLVNDILDVSKIASGKLELEKVEFRLHNVIDDIYNILHPLAAAKQLAFDCEIDQDVPQYLIGDQVRLQQVLVNLISNAIKFTSQGKISVYVKLFEAAKDKASLLFRVVDTGIGIPADVILNLFQDFTQASPSTVRTHGGTGLGLSICKKLVTLMGGDIGVQSSLGKGSTFWFTVIFPLVTDTPLSVLSAQESENLPTLNILVAEDHPINQQAIKGILTNLGQKVTIANNGQEALQLFDKDSFDMVFLDINMPEMDGLQTNKRLRNKEIGRNLPIIAFTADTITTSPEEFKSLGFDDIASKPINKAQLIQLITKYSSILPAQSPENEPIQIAHESIAADNKALNDGFIYSLLNEIGKEPLTKMLITYKTEAQELINQLRTEENIEESYKLAHTLAGISENLGVQEIGKIARSIMVILKKEQNRPLDLINKIYDKFPLSTSDIDSIIDKF
ncbi:PAS domain-containing hybrid sensor histidine kinase/response regulator [Candidatus Odyssella thessalonicensis]|uniref:PAS domain-containing hybrid sensor histidine kinase/response regulator n=1 Tax=Candidatus Odyssella thessalonicensis TaxID=84647 RepID=UPI000225C1FD|nr:PAS domain-containing hybrid sensor histidine kinase/response regulator [Candidatus Odyssella thessalonicensis]